MALPEPDEDEIELFERLEEHGPSRATLVRLRLELADAWPPEDIPSTREGAEFAEACGSDPVRTAAWCAKLEPFLSSFVDAVNELVVQASCTLGRTLDSPGRAQTDLDSVRKDASAADGAQGLDWSDPSSIRVPTAAQAVTIELLGVDPGGAVAGIVESVRRMSDSPASEHDAVVLAWAQAAQLRSLRPADASNAPTDPRLVAFRLEIAWAAGGEVRAQALSADHPSLLNAARRLVERNLTVEHSLAAFHAIAVEAGHPNGIEVQDRGPEKRPRRFTSLHAVLLVVLLALFVMSYVLQK